MSICASEHFPGVITLEASKECFALLKNPPTFKELYRLCKNQTGFGFTQWHVRGLNIHYLTAALHFQMPDKTSSNTMKPQIYCLP